MSADQVADADAFDDVNTDAQNAEVWTVSRHGAVPFHALPIFFRVLLVSRRSFQSPRPRESAEPTRNGEQKNRRTTLRRHMFNSFLSLLHPPVHLRQLSA